MPNILITGASGFVGSNLARRLLQSGDKITIFIRKESNLWRLKDILSLLEVYVVDLGDVESLKSIIRKIKPDIVYHLGTYGGYPFQQDLSTTIQNNIFFSVNLMSALEACNGLVKFINFGSSSEYGPKPKSMQETDTTEPVTPYGITKVAQTLFARYFFKQRKLPTVTLRLFSVYGSYEEPGRLIHDIMTAVIRKHTLKLSSPFPRRDFIHIDDVVTVLRKVSEIPDVEGEIFNVGSGREYSVGEVVNIARDITKGNLEVLWGFEEKKRTFDTETRWVADIRKAKKLLNWKPTITLREGLLRTYRWYGDNISLYNKDS